VLLTGGSDNDGAAVSQNEVYRVETARFRSAKDSLEDDGLPPHITGSLPRNGADSVAADALLALRESKPASAVNRETVTLSGPYGAVEARVVAAEFGRLAFITPLSPLLPGSAYTLTVDGAVDDAGAAMEAEAISFPTAVEVIAPELSDSDHL
jgi:hypothetical protein